MRVVPCERARHSEKAENRSPLQICNPAFLETAENDRAHGAYHSLAREHHWKSLKVKKVVDEVCTSAVLTHLLVLSASPGYLCWNAPDAVSSEIEVGVRVMILGQEVY